MHLVTFGPAGQEQPGVLIEGMVVPLSSSLDRLGLPTSGDTGLLAAIPARTALCSMLDAEVGIPRSQVRLGPPILRPSKIIEVGFNARSLLSALGSPPFTEPALYAKAPSTIIGPSDVIVCPPRVGKLDYEVEVAVVIGQRCRKVSSADAPRVIAGYTVANDVTARDVQFGDGEGGRYHRQNYRSKSFDTFCPLGPALYVPRDGASAPFGIASYVNDQRRQDGDTTELVWSIPQLIEFISADMTLNPGDIILTGAPAGVGYLMEPPQFLQDGDVVKGVISEIGEICNPVRTQR